MTVAMVLSRHPGVLTPQPSRLAFAL